MSEKRTPWVLDTETKGTGAEMVPLERLEERKRLRRKRDRIRVIGPKADSPDDSVERDEARAPRRFRIVSVLSRQTLAEDVGISEALDALRGVSSVVDVNVFVREPDEGNWRPLTMPERRRLWSLRDDAPAASAPARR